MSKRWERILAAAWLLLGLFLIIWVLYRIVVGGESLKGWIIVLGYAFPVLFAGWRMSNPGLMGKPVLRFVSIVMLSYAAIWVLFGGMEDAFGYWPVLLFGSMLSAASLILCLYRRKHQGL